MSAFAELIAGFIGWFTNSARRYLNDTRHDLPVLEESSPGPVFISIVSLIPAAVQYRTR